MSSQDYIGANTTEVNTRYLQASANRAKGDVVRLGISSAGFVDVTLADDTDVYYVCVAQQDITSGAKGKYAERGPVKITVPSGNYTAGNGVHIINGAVADSGSTAETPDGSPSNNDFGVIVTGGNTVTEITVCLFGGEITAQT